MLAEKYVFYVGGGDQLSACRSRRCNLQAAQRLHQSTSPVGAATPTESDDNRLHACLERDSDQLSHTETVRGECGVPRRRTSEQAEPDGLGGLDVRRVRIEQPRGVDGGGQRPGHPCSPDVAPGRGQDVDESRTTVGLWRGDDVVAGSTAPPAGRNGFGRRDGSQGFAE